MAKSKASTDFNREKNANGKVENIISTDKRRESRGFNLQNEEKVEVSRHKQRQNTYFRPFKVNLQSLGGLRFRGITD